MTAVLRAMRPALILLLLLPSYVWGASERDPRVRAEFQRLNPCPNKEWQIRPGTQGGRRGACPGFSVDHMDALCAGGKDTLDNLMWLENEQHRLKTLMDIKRCAIIRQQRKAK